MSIVGRSVKVLDFDQHLEESCPVKKVVARALPYTCSAPGCFNNGRLAPSKLCAACNGTGYTGATFLPNNAHLFTAPFAQLFFIYADIQLGHGLYGSGGAYIQAIIDLGRIQLGDASMFTKLIDLDRATGTAFFCDTQKDRPRPDYIRNTDGQVFTVTKHLPISFGDEFLCRQYTLEEGAQGGARA